MSKQIIRRYPINKIDRISLTREQLLDAIYGLTSLEQVHEKLLGYPGKFNKRYRTFLNQKYGIDITKITTDNRNAQQSAAKDQQLNMIFVCDWCGNKYRNGDHHCDNKSGRHFCSDLCSHKFSANVNKEDRNKKKSEAMKEFLRTHLHTIRCAQCGNPYNASIFAKEGTGICDECAQQLKTCRICGAKHKKCKRPEICSLQKAFGNFIKCLGFNKATIGTEQVYAEFDRVRDWLYDLYWNKNLSIPDITSLTGYQYGDKNFIKILRRFIPLRGVQQGLQLSYEKKSHHAKDTFFKSGVHTAWNGSVIEYRSSYELDLCKTLDAGEILYQVEGMTVNYYDSVLKKPRFAIPDFYLPNYNMIIEVKSSFTFDKQNMIDKAKAYIENGYDFILEYEHKSYSYHDMLSIDCNMKNIKYYTQAKSVIQTTI